MSATVRKNFVFDATVAKHLEELAESMGKSLNKTVQELVEERYKEIEKQHKLALFTSLIGSGNGLFTHFSVQDTKSRMQ
jgi:macrodomain Ter protein organizer (MatP/YcbG family)